MLWFVIFGKILLMRYGMITATIAGMVALGMHLVIGCVADPQSWLVRDGLWVGYHIRVLIGGHIGTPCIYIYIHT